MNRPPKITRWLLRRCLPASAGGSILGDLYQEYRAFRPRALRGVWYRWTATTIGLRYVASGIRAGLHSLIDELRGAYGMGSDLRFALRGFRKNPGFTAMAVMTLALGIGANSAIFSLLDAAVLRPLPYESPEQLVKLELTSRPEQGGETEQQPWWSYPKFEALRDGTTSYQGVAAYATHYYNLTGIPVPARLATETVSATYFDVLGIKAARGRLFLPEEDRDPGAHPVVVLSEGLWQDRFGGDPSIVGKTLHLGATAMTVIGVAPRGFRGLSGKAQLWAPMAMVPELSRWDTALTWHGTHWHEVVARISSDVAPGVAEAELATLGTRLDEAFGRPGRIAGAASLPLDSLRVEPAMRRAVWILLGAVALVLIIGCVNVAGLMLTRSLARRRELSIRRAIGASRVRLVRQLLTESVLLSLLGGVAALGLASWLLTGLVDLVPAADGFLFETGAVRLDARVLWFTFGISLLTGVLFGIVPAMRAAGGDLSQTMRPGTPPPTRRGIHGFAPGQWIASVQVALAIVLLVGAGLLLKSLSHLRNVESGFIADRVLTLAIEPDLPEPRAVTRVAFKRQLLERFAAIPGVESVGLSNCAPLSGRCWVTDVQAIDGKPLEGEQPFLIGVQYIAPDHFSTLGVSLLRGRAFTPTDDRDAPLVATINETAANRLWPGEDPIGRRIVVGESIFLDDRSAEIVGVVRDVRFVGPETPAGPDIFLPALQGGPGGMLVFLKSQVEPTSLVPTLRREVLALDANLPIYDVQTMSERSALATARARFASLLLSIFAGTALVLAAVGLYGVISSQVGRRTREIGIRIALGAETGQVLRPVMGRAASLAGFGLLLGLAGAVATSRLLSGLLFEVGTTDPLTFGATAGLLTVVALLAGYVPARRATRVDPNVALREE